MDESERSEGGSKVKSNKREERERLVGPLIRAFPSSTIRVAAHRHMDPHVDHNEEAHVGGAA
jgi:hypothetical protein